MIYEMIIHLKREEKIPTRERVTQIGAEVASINFIPHSKIPFQSLSLRQGGTAAVEERFWPQRFHFRALKRRRKKTVFYVFRRENESRF
jgi:hypothetical protein